MQQWDYAAPWGTGVEIITVGGMVLLTGIPLFNFFAVPRSHPVWSLGLLLPLSILIGSAVCVIRGYELTADSVMVKRLGWRSRIDLTSLVSAETDPKAMARSLRTFGNGGLFCFAGRFRNRHLGPYRAFAMDPKRSVVLRFPDRTVVVTPDRPDEFVARIRELRGI